MDHKQQHLEDHQKERKREQREWKEHNRELAGKRHGIHPACTSSLVVVIGAAVLVWTFIIW